MNIAVSISYFEVLHYFLLSTSTANAEYIRRKNTVDHVPLNNGRGETIKVRSNKTYSSIVKSPQDYVKIA